ncbi:hypothetical protein BGZ51_000698, partial [Haplosporangium sp. Z 767]
MSNPFTQEQTDFLNGLSPRIKLLETSLARVEQAMPSSELISALQNLPSTITAFEER